MANVARRGNSWVVLHATNNMVLGRSSTREGAVKLAKAIHKKNGITKPVRVIKDPKMK